MEDNMPTIEQNEQTQTDDDNNNDWFGLHIPTEQDFNEALGFPAEIDIGL